MIEQQSLKINPSEVGERIDQLLADKFSQYSRSYFSRLIKNKDVLVNGDNVKPAYILKEHDNISVVFKEDATISELEGEDIALDIIFENDDIIVLDKQPGIVVHPAAGNRTGTLVHALVNHFPKITEAVYDSQNEVSRTRPGLVHRLDKGTSGVMIVAKNSRAMHSLSRQIQNRTVEKIYWGLCYGWPKIDEGRLTSFLGRSPKNRRQIADVGEGKGKEAITGFKVLKCYTLKNSERISLLEFNLHTGRTHQIRVQTADMGNPILGDIVYGNKTSMKASSQLNIKRQLLHAKKITISLPGDDKSTQFEAAIPEEFTVVIKQLTEISDK